jgi:hypothetical protein
MLYLRNIFNSSPKQQKTILLENNNTFTFNIYYRSLTSGWYYDLSYSTLNFNVKGQKITHSLNILDPFRERLNFGLSFRVEDGGEIWYLDDFTNERVKVYLLNENDLANIKTEFNKIV